MAAATLSPPPLVYNSANTAVTVTSNYASTTLKSSNYSSSVVTITSATRDKALSIEGNAKANKIVGTSANDTINGAAGNDTLTGGAGSDVFIFDGKGMDVVTDYTAGEDMLKLTSGTVSSYSISGSDVTFKVGSGSVKVSGGKNKAVTVVDSKNKIYTYDGGLIYNDSVAKAKAVSVSAAYGNTLASYGASVVTIDASARTKAINIQGNAAANVITGTSGNDTINGGAGNDTLIGGKGKDLFVYENGGGNDFIMDYTAGQDTIKIVGDSVSSYSISGSDATFKIGNNTLKVKNGKSAAVLVVDEDKNVSLYQSGAIYNAASATKATAITVTSAYGNSFTAGTSVVSVDASPRTATINLTGNTKNNYLVGGAGKDVIDGGKGNDSIRGGKGADILTGGAGSDVFIYADGDGTDAITDYISGEDVIKLTSGAVKSYSVKNGDAILKVGSGAITLKGAGTSAVSVLDTDDVLTVYNGGLIYNDPKISRADVVTITADFDSEFDSYGASVETIDAAARTKAIEITGNGADNFILGGKGKDTISGGKGADTIYAGKGNDLLTGGAGVDVFFYATGDGNDTITDYGTGDIISVDGSVSYSTKNDDAVLKIGTAGLTLKDAADTAITIVGADSLASIYSGKNVSTKTWTGIAIGTSVTETVTIEVTLPAETIEVEVTVPSAGETVEVTLPAETITVDSGGSGSLIMGTTGNDTLVSKVGNDTLTGLAGDDIFVYEGDGDFDVITDYGNGADKISIGTNSIGGALLVGNDVLFSIGDGILKLTGTKDKKVDIVSNSGESIYLNGEISDSGTDTGSTDLIAVSLTNGNDNYTNTDTNVTIYALSGNDTVLNSSVTSIGIYGGAGDDSLYNYYGNSVTIDGEAGNDTIHNWYGYSVAISGGGNDDTIINDHGDSVTINTGDGDDSVYNFYSSSVTISGGDGNDSISNYRSNNVSINGNAGNDTIRNESSNTTINGGLGMDRINNYGSSVTIDGGDGNDRIDNYSSSVMVDGSAGNDYVYNWEGENVTINGGLGDDCVHNRSTSIAISGGEGNDTIDNEGSCVEIDGGAGNDTIYNSGNSVTIDGGAGNDLIYMNDSTTIGNVLQYSDGDGNDTVHDFSTKDTIQISEGSYTTTRSGSDIIVSVGEGNITLIGAGSLSTINIVGDSDISGGGEDTVPVPADFTAVSLTTGDDKYTVTASKQIIYALAGNDTVLNSSIVGIGIVGIYGGAGDDIVSNNGSSVTVDGGAGNDYIYNYRGENVVINAGEGNDYIYHDHGVSVTIGGSAGNDSIHNYRGENVVINAGEGNDSIHNDYGDNVMIYSGAGDDSIDNRYGANTLIDGGEGADIIILSSGFSIYGNNTIHGGIGADTIYMSLLSTIGNIFQYTDGDGNDIVYHLSSYDTIQISGSYSTSKNDSDVIVSVGSGKITLVGASSLSAVNIVGDSDIGDGFTAVSLTTGDDKYTVTSSEQIVYALAGADTIRNNSLASVMIYGGDGADSIDNYYGDSVTIDGGVGNDEIHNYGLNVTIDGNEGNDRVFNWHKGNNVTINGGTGSDTITNFGKYVILNGGDGDDTIMNSESEDVSSTTSTTISSGNSTISGGKGNDFIYFVTDNSKNNLIRYASGDGDDTIRGYNSSDTIQISGGNYSTTQSGSDVIVAVGNGSITIKDYYGTVNIVSAGGNGNASVPWFAENDTNFITGAELDSLIEAPIANSVGALSVSGGDSMSEFVYDFALAHNDDK